MIFILNMKVIVILLIICVSYMTGNELDITVQLVELEKDMERYSIPEIEISLEVLRAVVDDIYVYFLKILNVKIGDYRKNNQLPPIYWLRSLDAITYRTVKYINLYLKNIVKNINETINSGKQPSDDDIKQFSTFYEELAVIYPGRFTELKVELADYQYSTVQQEIIKEQFIYLFINIKNQLKTLNSYLTIKLTNDLRKAIQDIINFYVKILQQVESYLTSFEQFISYGSSLLDIRLSQEALNSKAEVSYAAYIAQLSFIDSYYRANNKSVPVNNDRFLDSIYAKYVYDTKDALSGIVRRMKEAKKFGKECSKDDIHQFAICYHNLDEGYRSRFTELKLEIRENPDPIQQIIIREQQKILLIDIKDTIKTLKDCLKKIKFNYEEIRWIIFGL